MLLVTIDKFDFNPIVVNNSKMEPYRFVEDHRLQLFLTKPNDLLLEKSVETC